MCAASSAEFSAGVGSADCESRSAPENGESRSARPRSAASSRVPTATLVPAPQRRARRRAASRPARVARINGGLGRLDDHLDARSRAGDVDRHVRAVGLEHRRASATIAAGHFGTNRQTRSPRSQPASRRRRASRLLCLLELSVRQPLVAHDERDRVGPRLRLTRHVVLEQVVTCDASSGRARRRPPCARAPRPTGGCRG